VRVPSLSRFTPRHARAVAIAVVAGLVLFANLCGHVGIDYGYHWDEHYQIEGVSTCVDNLIFLPQKYIYGSIYFLVGMAVVLRHNPSFPAGFLHDLRSRPGAEIIDLAGYPSVQKFQRVSHVLLGSPDYLIENRLIFFALSSLVIVWVYLLMRRLHPQRYAGALAAAAFVAGSWELQYHARFLAVDALMAQIFAGQLLLLAAAWLAPTPASRFGWYLGAGVAAGLALSCKATGLATFPPVALFPLLHPEPMPARRRLAVAVAGLSAASVTALLFQPGLLIDPLRVISVLRREAWEYGGAVATHPNLTSGFFDRVGSFLAWLWLAVPSPFVPVAVIASTITIAGLILFVRAHRRLSILGGVACAALLFAMVKQPLLIVRHYLLFIPVMALGFGHGITFIAHTLRTRPWIWRVAVGALCLVFVVQERWLYRAAASVRDSTAASIAADGAAALLRSPEAIRLSPQAYAELAPRLAPRFRCTSEASEAADLPLVIHLKEREWRSNSFGLSRRLYGPRDVNYDWYASWIGRPEHSPLVILSPRAAHRQNVPTAGFGVCKPVQGPPG